jgi:hypothetical protein
MNLTGIGGDYLVNYSSGDPSAWEPLIPLLAQWQSLGYSTSRLGFVFPGLTGMSVLDYTKFDAVLTYFASIGVQVIPVLQNNTDDVSAFVANPNFISDWLQFVTYYKGDTRIAAVEIFGEPNSDTSYYAGSSLKLQQLFKSLIDQIHAIDPTRLIIYPTGNVNYPDALTWIADLRTTGIINDQLVVFDIIHPYLFESSNDTPPPPNNTPTQIVQYNLNTWMLPCIAAFGPNRCFCGETYANPNLTQSLQVQFLTEQINSFIANGVQFDIWATLEFLQQQQTSFSFQAMNAANKPPTNPGTTPTVTKAPLTALALFGALSIGTLAIGIATGK